MASLKSEPTSCLLINRIPALRLLISSLPGLASRTHVESLDKPPDSTSLLEALPGKLDIKRHSPSILYLYFFHKSIGYQSIHSCIFLRAAFALRSFFIVVKDIECTMFVISFALNNSSIIRINPIGNIIVKYCQ